MARWSMKCLRLDMISAADSFSADCYGKRSKIKWLRKWHENFSIKILINASGAERKSERLLAMQEPQPSEFRIQSVPFTF